MCRSDSFKSEVEKKGGITAKGDALDKESVEKLMASIDDLNVVVSTIGGTTADPKADSEGNINIINAAKAAGVARFVLVTSIGTGDSKVRRVERAEKDAHACALRRPACASLKCGARRRS